MRRADFSRYRYNRYRRAIVLAIVLSVPAIVNAQGAAGEPDLPPPRILSAAEVAAGLPARIADAEVAAEAARTEMVADAVAESGARSASGPLRRIPRRGELTAGLPED